MPTASPAANDPPPLTREFRGVWVATVANIDWPSKPGLPTETQKAELIAILDKTKSLNMNAVVFQVRPMADALYPSELEPWSEYLTGRGGTPPEPFWDPLQFAVDEAHARGLEIHAWFNPYRARHPSAKTPSPADHMVQARPDLAKKYGTHYWLNPTNPEVQAHSLAVILDVVKRYDVDGVHMDDYFYPYKEKDEAGNLLDFPDNDTWTAYTEAGGKLSRDDWRRDAVNQFVKKLYTSVKAAKPWVKVGISPFGIWKPGHPPGIAGFNQYEGLYADAKLWLNEGWVDYFVPQLYWPIAQEKQSFPKLLDWWVGENAKSRHLWPGLYTSRVTGEAKGWPAKEVVDQIEVTRRTPGSTGVIHFSMKALVNNPGGVADAVKSAYAEPALVPATPWLAQGDPPAAPKVEKAMVDGKPVLRVTAGNDPDVLIIRGKVGDKWETEIHGMVDGVVTVPMTSNRDFRISVQDRAGRESLFATPK